MDTAPVDSLIDVLNKETAMYEDILKLSKNKTDIIVEGKVSDLESITKLEQTMILQLGKLEAEREKLVVKLTAQLNIDTNKLTLARLSEKLPKEQREKLNQCQNRLPGVIKDLSNANVLNSKLIKSSLDYIDFSINILTSAEASGNNYGNSGVSRDSKRKNFFDVKL